MYQIHERKDVRMKNVHRKGPKPKKWCGKCKQYSGKLKEGSDPPAYHCPLCKRDLKSKAK